MLSYLGTVRRHSSQITKLLTTVLANEFALYSKTKKTYWAFSEKRFTVLLQILKEQCFDMEDNINEVAELLRKLNGKTTGSLEEFTALSTLKETQFNTSPRAIIKELMENNRLVIAELEVDIPLYIQTDDPIIYFIKWLVQQHENAIWVLKNYLKQFPVLLLPLEANN